MAEEWSGMAGPSRYGAKGWLFPEGAIAQTAPAHAAPIIVVGIPRSGTSAVAGILWNLGVALGLRLTGPDRHNPKGYFEDRDYIELHEAYTRGLLIPARVPLIADYFGMLRQQSGARWGWKDPRTLLLAPMYQCMYPAARWLLCTRQAEAVQHSIDRAFGAAVMHTYADWADLVERFWNVAPPHVLSVAFEDVLSDPETTVTTIAQFCDVPLPDDRRQQAIAHVS